MSHLVMQGSLPDNDVYNDAKFMRPAGVWPASNKGCFLLVSFRTNVLMFWGPLFTSLLVGNEDKDLGVKW